MTGSLDRRQLMTLGLLAGARLAVPALAGAQPPIPEPRLLAELLSTERLTIAVVTRVITSPHLGRRARLATRRILAAEHEHAAAIEQTLRRLGVAPARVRRQTLMALDRGLRERHVHRTLTGLHDEHGCLDLLLDLEAIAEGALYAAMSQLNDPAHQRLVAELMAAEAQHEAVLGLLRDPKSFDRAAPYAFVEGIQP